MGFASELLALVHEMERVITRSPEQTTGVPMLPTTAVVDYYAVTPKGSRSRFANRGIPLNQMAGNPRSETAVLAYLKKQHPQAEIQIQSISFR